MEFQTRIYLCYPFRHIIQKSARGPKRAFQPHWKSTQCQNQCWRRPKCLRCLRKVLRTPRSFIAHLVLQKLDVRVNGHRYDLKTLPKLLPIIRILRPSLTCCRYGSNFQYGSCCARGYISWQRGRSGQWDHELWCFQWHFSHVQHGNGVGCRPRGHYNR